MPDVAHIWSKRTVRDGNDFAVRKLRHVWPIYAVIVDERETFVTIRSEFKSASGILSLAAARLRLSDV